MNSLICSPSLEVNLQLAKSYFQTETAALLHWAQQREDHLPNSMGCGHTFCACPSMHALGRMEEILFYYWAKTARTFAGPFRLRPHTCAPVFLRLLSKCLALAAGSARRAAVMGADRWWRRCAQRGRRFRRNRVYPPRRPRSSSTSRWSRGHVVTFYPLAGSLNMAAPSFIFMMLQRFLTYGTQDSLTDGRWGCWIILPRCGLTDIPCVQGVWVNSDMPLIFLC